MTHCRWSCRFALAVAVAGCLGACSAQRAATPVFVRTLNDVAGTYELYRINAVPLPVRLLRPGGPADAPPDSVLVVSAHLQLQPDGSFIDVSCNFPIPADPTAIGGGRTQTHGEFWVRGGRLYMFVRPTDGGGVDSTGTVVITVRQQGIELQAGAVAYWYRRTASTPPPDCASPKGAA